MNPIRICKLLVVIMGILVAVHFVSCGGGGGGSTTPDATDTEGETTPDEGVVPEDESSPGTPGSWTMAPDPGLVASADGVLTDTDIVISTADGEGTARGYGVVTILAGTRAFIGDNPAQGPLTTEIVFHDADSATDFPGAMGVNAKSIGDKTSSKAMAKSPASYRTYDSSYMGTSTPFTYTFGSSSYTAGVPLFTDLSKMPAHTITVNGQTREGYSFGVMEIQMRDADGKDVTGFDPPLTGQAFPYVPHSPDIDAARALGGNVAYRPDPSQVYTNTSALPFFPASSGSYDKPDDVDYYPMFSTVMTATSAIAFYPVLSSPITMTSPSSYPSYVHSLCECRLDYASPWAYSSTDSAWWNNPDLGFPSCDGNSYFFTIQQPGYFSALCFAGGSIYPCGSAVVTSTVEVEQTCTCATAAFQIIDVYYSDGTWTDCGTASACQTILHMRSKPYDTPLTNGETLSSFGGGSGCTMTVICGNQNSDPSGSWSPGGSSSRDR